MTIITAKNHAIAKFCFDMEKVNGVIECLREDCFLCKNISSEWLEMVRYKREVLSFKKGELIFREGEAVQGIYFILEGKVKIDMSWGDRKYILRLASDGEILGHRGFGLDDIYPINATALEPTTVCYIPTELFRSILKTNGNLLYELTFFYADELKKTERRMKHLAHSSVKARLAESLIMIDDAFGSEQGWLSHNMSRKDLASMAGTTYESVIRMLNELVKEKSIQLKDKAIKIVDKRTLIEMIEEQERAKPSK